MPDLLKDSTSTAKSEAVQLPVGFWKFLADIPSGDAASVAIFQRKRGSSNDMPVVADGAVVALTKDDPARIVISGDDEFLVQRSSGSAAITVSASQIPT